MEQNNFEKKIQNKLDELKIPPTESVWANVEKRIGKKEKKRRMIFILFFLLLFLLSGGYWLLNSSRNIHEENQQISNVIKTEKGSKATNNADSSFEKSKKTTVSNYRNIDSSGFSKEKNKISKVHSQNKIENEKEKGLPKLTERFTLKPKENYSKRTNNANSDIEVNNIIKHPERKARISETEDIIDIGNLKDTVRNKTAKDHFLNHLETEKNTEKFMVKGDSSMKKISKNPDQNLWNLGITFSGGTSLIGGGLFEGDKSLADVNASSPSGGVPSYYSPSPIKNSTAFIAGVFIEKNISSKSKITVGVSYKYYSLINKVGNKIDSILSPPSQYFSSSYAYSSSNSSHSYRNNFHFLEVPVSVTIHLNRNKKLPLSWNAGANISQLISTNALQFQTNPGFYYHDNSFFNKTGFGLHTGFSVTFFPKEKTPLTIGPYFYYSATDIADKGLYGTKHFSLIGIRTEILFHKK